MWSCIPTLDHNKKKVQPFVTVKDKNTVEIVFTNGRYVTVKQSSCVINHPDDEIERSAFETYSYHKVPKAILCPITKAPMQDPVLCLDGHSYERKAITKWLKKKKFIACDEFKIQCHYHDTESCPKKCYSIHVR